jgi:hypothetical protein
MRRHFYFRFLFIVIFLFLNQKMTVFAQNTGIFITKQPSDQSVCPGATAAIFSVEVRAGVDVPLEYQWFLSTDGGQDFTAAPNGVEASFSVPSVVSSIFPEIKIKVQISATGSKMTESAVANLVGAGSIHFTISPKKETTVAGGNLVFETKFDTKSAEKTKFEYQWQRSRYASAVWEDLAGETNSMLWLKKITPDFNGNLVRLILRGGGICDKIIGQPASVLVENAPLVKITPAEKTVCEHGSASFGVQIQNGTGGEKIRWQVSRDEGKKFTDLKGETEKVFTAQNLTADLSGSQFRAVIEGPGGLEFFTGIGRVLVNGTVSISQQPADFLACIGDSAVFQMKVRTTGTNATYQWQTSSDDGKTWADLPNARSENIAVYVNNDAVNGQLVRALVTAGDCGEMVSSVARINVVQQISFAQNNQYSINEGKNAEIRTIPTPSPGTFLGQWQVSTDGGQLWSNVRDATSTVLTVPSVTANLSGRLFKYKYFSKECGQIFFSEPILMTVESR